MPTKEKFNYRYTNNSCEGRRGVPDLYVQSDAGGESCGYCIDTDFGDDDENPS